MQRKNDGKTTVPRKEFDRTPFGEHCYLTLIDIKIVELATLTMYSCKLAKNYAISLIFRFKAIINAKL